MPDEPTPVIKEMAGKQEPLDPPENEDDGIEIHQLKSGADDPTTGAKIKEPLYYGKDFIVTIDVNLSLNWYAKPSLTYADDLSLWLGKIGLADALVDRIFKNEKEDRLAYKRMLGDVLARLLDDQSSIHASVAFAEVEARIEEHARERTRMAYINRAKIWVGVAAALLLLITIFRPWLYTLFNNRVIFNILVCSLLGAIGSFISAFLRFKDYKGGIKSGLRIHELDGFLRVIFGVVAGLFIALAMQGGILAAFAVSTDANKIWLFFFFGLIAGASERLVPNLIEQVENQQVNGKPPPPPGGGGGGSSAPPPPKPAKPKPDNPVAPAPAVQDPPDNPAAEAPAPIPATAPTTPDAAAGGEPAAGNATAAADDATPANPAAAEEVAPT